MAKEEEPIEELEKNDGGRMEAEHEKTGEKTAVRTGTEQQLTAEETGKKSPPQYGGGTGEEQQLTAEQKREQQLTAANWAKTGYVKCPVCGEPVTEQGRGTHFRNKHSDLVYEEYKTQFEPTPPPGGQRVATDAGKTAVDEGTAVEEKPEEEESEGLAKSVTDKLLYELEKNMETFNVPGTGKGGREKRKRIIAVLEKAPAYRDWQHVHSLLDTAGVSPTDAKAICDMTFSQVSQEDLKREAGQAQEAVAGNKESQRGESIDDHLKKTMDRLTMTKMIKNLGSEDMSEIAKETKDEDIDKLLKTMMNRQMMLQMIKSFQSGGIIGSDSKKNPSTEDIIRIIEERERMREGKLTKEDIIKILDEREKKKESSLTKEDVAKIIEDHGKKSGGGMSEEKFLQLLDAREKQKSEEKEKTTLMQTLDGVRQALDNLHGRVSTIEQGGVPGKHSEGGETGWNKKVLDAAGNKLISLLEKGELTEDKVRSIAKEMAPAPSAPPGTRSEYDMRVEQAQHEADARKIEAREKRMGYEAIAGGIRDGLQGLGFNVGAGLSTGPTGLTPTSTQPNVMAPSKPQLPIRGADGQLYVECPHCHTSLMIPEGQARVVCPSCSGTVDIMTREEAARINKAREVEKKPKAKKQAKKLEVKKKAEEKLVGTPKQEVKKTEQAAKTEEAQKTEKPEKTPDEKPSEKEKPKEESNAEVAGKTEGSSS